VLSHVLEKYAAPQYQSRKKEVRVEKRQRKPRFGLFFVNSLSHHIPGESVGLHVFEPRYRILVDRAMATTRKFVLARGESTIGVLVHINRVRAHPDGRSLVEGKTMYPVQLSDIRPEDNAFGLVSAETLEVEADEPTGDSKHEVEDYAAEIQQLLDQYSRESHITLERLIGRHGPIPESDHNALCFWAFCAVRGRNELVEEMLSSASLVQRMRLTVNMLTEGIDRTKSSKRLKLIVLLVGIIVFVLYHLGTYSSGESNRTNSGAGRNADPSNFRFFVPSGAGNF
jgi:Lon protease-like protein